MDNKVPFPHDEAVKNKVFPPGPRKPRFIVTRAVVSPWTVTFVFLLGLALLILGNGLNAAYGVRGVPVDVMGDFGVALATGAVLFVLERNFFVSKRQDKRAKFDIGPLLDEALEELRQRLEPTPSQLHLACFATVRKGLFTLEQEVYRFMPDGDNGWPQSLELGQGPIGSAVLEQRTLAVDVDGWRWCIVPFVGRTRAGCLMAAIPHTDVKNSVTQTCWSSLSDFSELAASIIEPVVV